MGLSSWVRRCATPSPLVITAPGGQPVRWAVESVVRARGWATALAPGQADVLVICGAPGPELTEALRVVWAQLPAPRARVQLTSADGVGAALDAARAQLSDHEVQRAERRIAGAGPVDGDLPGGLTMADVGEDRDGLSLDRLHPVLGPALTAWPAGLRVDTTMQGDVLQEVSARFVDERVAVAASERVLGLDALAALLCTQMWVQPAREAARLRDAYHAGDQPDVELAAFGAGLGRSRRLRAATRGLGVHEGHDVYDRLLGRLAGRPVRPVHPDVLPELIVGAELASARLVINSLDWVPASEPARG